MISVISLQVFDPALNESVVQPSDPLTPDTGLSNIKKVSEKGGGASLKENVCQVNDYHISSCNISVPVLVCFYDRGVFCRCVSRQVSCCCVRDSAVELFIYSVSASARLLEDASSVRSALQVSSHRLPVISEWSRMMSGDWVGRVLMLGGWKEHEMQTTLSSFMHSFNTLLSLLKIIVKYKVVFML